MKKKKNALLRLKLYSFSSVTFKHIYNIYSTILWYMQSWWGWTNDVMIMDIHGKIMTMSWWILEYAKHDHDYIKSVGSIQLVTHIS